MSLLSRASAPILCQSILKALLCPPHGLTHGSSGRLPFWCPVHKSHPKYPARRHLLNRSSSPCFHPTFSLLEGILTMLFLICQVTFSTYRLASALLLLWSRPLFTRASIHMLIMSEASWVVFLRPNVDSTQNVIFVCCRVIFNINIMQFSCLPISQHLPSSLKCKALAVHKPIGTGLTDLLHWQALPQLYFVCLIFLKVTTLLCICTLKCLLSAQNDHSLHHVR